MVVFFIRAVVSASRCPPQNVIRYTALGSPVMWRQTLATSSPPIVFSDPATSLQIEAVGRSLGCQIPADLHALLSESNGLLGEYSLPLVWETSRIQKDNLAFRSNSDFAELYMPFDHLLFFGDGGNGDQFAYAILAGEVRNADVFQWDHETDSRFWVAPSLKKYIEWAVSGKLRRSGAV